ncbi:MAG TPA: hypothetical protein VHH15_12210 [Actinophytocola sp.]|nr:hypothetical protein [Actinophytocola sp.]
MLVGVLSVAAALAASHLVAGLIDATASPLVAVGNAVRDLSPPAVTEYAIGSRGDWKAPLQFGGVAVALLVVAAIAGLLARRRVPPIPHGATGWHSSQFTGCDQG